MNIVILGAGQVGRTVAESLEGEDNDVTLVDQESGVLKELQNRLDVRTVIGHAAHPEVLERAGTRDADMVLAITNSDETNMVACQAARFVFNTPKCLARIRSPEYLEQPGLFGDGGIPIDYLISPEQLVTTYIKHVIERPNVLQAADFAGGKVQLVLVRTNSGGSIVGRALGCLWNGRRKPKARVVAIFRDRKTVIPDDDTVVEVGDEILVAAARRDVSAILAAFRRAGSPARRVMIAGGGRIGNRLAESVASRYYVKLIERDDARCHQLAESLDGTIILKGDASDADLLTEEGIKNIDFFGAVTNDDEANIVSSMLAKKLGARYALSIVNRSSYVDVAEGSAVDIVVSPAQVMIGAILAHIRRGDVLTVHEFRRGKSEAIEVSVHGDRQSSKVIGRRPSELPLPDGVVVSVLVRGNDVILSFDDTVIEADDRLVLFLSD
ncbi:MAG TPA: Trk system potassium transporter TrkA, partial [Arenicellales bacterium]|nr:Trk system potassium transporter TrkA [Arenicellales bacterium]